MTLNPVVIGNEEEFGRAVPRLGDLDFPDRKPTPEERALREIVAALIAIYDCRTRRPARWFSF